MWLLNYVTGFRQYKPYNSLPALVGFNFYHNLHPKIGKYGIEILQSVLFKNLIKFWMNFESFCPLNTVQMNPNDLKF